MNQNILITGGDGVLAQYVKKSLKKYSIAAPGHKELDVTDKGSIENFFKKNSPHAVVHLAAKTDVDWCERNPKETFLINSEGTKNIADACKEHRSFLIFISTAAVFNGKKKIFFEEDIPDPINIYGKSKLQGEKYVQEILRDFSIIRAAWLIGGNREEKKFVSFILEQIQSGEKEIKAVDDKYGTITYARELADLVEIHLNSKKRGIYHFGSKGICSRFDIAKEIVRVLKSDTNIIPVTSDYFSGRFSAPRPVREVIGSKKMEFENSWEKSLENYLRDEIIPGYGLK